MYGTFTYIWSVFMVHVGKYTIHVSYNYYYSPYFGSLKHLYKTFICPAVLGCLKALSVWDIAL